MISNLRNVDADLAHASVHDVATLLKRFFSQLPECILVDDLYEAWMAIAELPEANGSVFLIDLHSSC